MVILPANMIAIDLEWMAGTEVVKACLGQKEA
jgi:hypothetical protein